MSLSCFNIINFRNLENIHFDFNNHCNIFYGKNGSGKTSILEAVYYLALGRSFRSHLLRRIIKYGADGFSIFGKIEQVNNYISVGVDRSIINGKRIKVAGEDVSSNVEITKLLPLQLLNQDSYRLFDDGPKVRRQFIDWGLFHVEQNFLSLWRRVERIIEQRNAILRTNFKPDYIKTWDKELSQLGFELHEYRKKYIEKFISIAQLVLRNLLCDFSISISYFAGWNTEQDLMSVLADNFKNDLYFGYTSAGPQRADLRITANKVPAKDALSRGQQKLLLYGLQISQGILLNELTGKSCIYLVDDLPAELDSQKKSLISEMLLNLQSQIFVTGLTRDDLKNFSAPKNTKMFHVEQGAIKT
ncbi:MAG: DNA replication/repair protein RecF [bacterium]